MSEREQRLVLDLGVCPYCGAEYIYEARDGRAIGRKPPEACCREQAKATLRWMAVELGIAEKRIQQGLPVDREAMNALREDMERIQRKLKEL